MPVTIVANGANQPPQIEITIASPDGSAMTAISLVRSVGGVKTATRVQPTTGVVSRFVEDPEAPYDVAVTYIATVSTAGGLTGNVMTSNAVVLTPSPLAFWATHPTVPSRSMAIDVDDFSKAGISQIGDVVRAAQANQHVILGSETPLLTKLGNRKAGSGSIEIRTMTDAERLKLLALVNDETPILLRAPAAWGWGWEDGYYAFGDVAEGRVIQYGPEQARSIKIPFQRVAAPAGTQQSSWSWGGLLAGYADWNAVANGFRDWNGVTGNNPG
jgi:hypothetical protein